MKSLFRALPRAVLGFLASCGAVSVLIFFYLNIGTTSDGGKISFLFIFLIFPFVLQLAALPFLGWFTASELKSVNRADFHIIAGTLAGLIGYCVVVTGNRLFSFEELSLAAFSGLTGGIIYWAVSGRHAGSR